ncbi:hypothetical protein LguiA_012080 [Lonicera macranthoides]
MGVRSLKHSLSKEQIISQSVCDSQIELKKGVIPWRVIRCKLVGAILIRGLYAHNHPTHFKRRLDNQNKDIWQINITSDQRSHLFLHHHHLTLRSFRREDRRTYRARTVEFPLIID